MAKEFDEEGFNHPTVKHVTDMVHDLLNGADGGIIGGDRDRDTMRVCFDIPKAWILFAAWKTMTRRDADTGKLEHWAVEQHDLDDEAVWDFMRRQVRPYLYRLLDNELHASLHHVCHGMDGMFWTGEDDAPDEPEDPKSPF